MKKIFLYATLGFSVLLGSCRPAYVDPYPPGGGENTYTFVDEFDDNRNGWNFSDPAWDAYGVIANGTFSFNYLDPTGVAYYKSKDIRFNPDRDFVLQTRIGSDNNMGLLFGYDEATGAYGYSFTISYDGHFALWDEGLNGGPSDITAIVAPTLSSAVIPNGDWNELSIEQVGNNWVGYINNSRVFTVPARYIVKGSVGFVVMADTRGEADYLQADFY